MLYLTTLLLIALLFIGKSWLVFYLSAIFTVVPAILFSYGLRKALIVSLSIWVCILFRIFKKDLNIESGALMLIAGVSIFFIGYAIENLFKSRIRYSRTNLEKLRNIHDNLAKDEIHVKTMNNKLENELLEIENLYELTKIMSTTLEFRDIFNIPSYSLKRLFDFKFCRLILISEEDNKSFEKIYQIISSDLEEKRDHPLKLRSLLVDTSKLLNVDETELSFIELRNILPIEKEISKFILEKRESIIVRSDYEDVLGIAKTGSLKTLIATGLMIENKIIGIMYAADLAPADFERFMIIADQFALELEKVKLYQMLQEMAILDNLTGVYVRRYLLERLKEELIRAAKHNTKFSFLMLDIDHFKQCNDNLGHLVGDVVLKEVAQLIRSNVREIDLVARFGGEEFCVGLPDTSKNEAMYAAERIRQAVEQYVFKAYDETLNITVSIGIATFPDDAADIEHLIDAADKFLYTAKGRGRNRVCA